MLVEGGRKLLSGAGELLPQVICFQGETVPFILKGGQQRGYRSQCRWAGAGDAGGVDGEEVVGREGLAGAGLGAVFVDVLLNQALFVDDTYETVVSSLERGQRRRRGRDCDATNPTFWTRQALGELLQRLQTGVSKDMLTHPGIDWFAYFRRA